MRGCGAKGQKGLCSSRELSDELSEILWGRTYVASFLRQYPELFKVGCNSNGSTSTVGKSTEAARSFLDNPLNCFLQTGA